MSEMVERAVAALNQELARQMEATPAPGREWDRQSWTATGGVIELDKLVRAVVEGLRPASADLLDALGDAMGDTPKDHECAPAVWDAMIDEILEE